MAMARRQYPRRVHEHAVDHPDRVEAPTGQVRTERDSEADRAAKGDAELLRWLRAGSGHFRSFAFRGAFVEYCLDSGTLQAVLGLKFKAGNGKTVHLDQDVFLLRASRVTRRGGAAIIGHSPPAVVVEDRSALDAVATLHGEHLCNKPALVFALHPLERNGVDRVSVEETELLVRTTYGLAYMTPSTCQDLARAYGSEWAETDAARGDAAMCAQADTHPKAGSEEGLLVENLLVLRHRAGPGPGKEIGPFLPEAWPLPLAYGFVADDRWSDKDHGGAEATLAEARMRYKLQVSSAVQSCAMHHCDGLIVGCAEGILGAHLPMDVAAEVWAEVLFGDGSSKGVAYNYRAVAFCIGGCTNVARQQKTRKVLEAAFAGRGGQRFGGPCGAPRFTGP